MRNVSAGIVLLLAVALPAPGGGSVWAGSEKPVLELSAVLGGHPRPPVVDGDRVYLPSGRGIGTWDFTDAANPVHLSTTEQPASGHVLALAKLGDYLYAGWASGDDNSGVTVYSLADPDRPELVNEVDDYANGLKILRNLVAANGHLFLFDSEQGVFYSPADDPEHPVFTQAFFAPVMYDHAAADGNHIYARSVNFIGNAALSVFDVTDPADIQGSGAGGFFSTELFAIDAAPPLVGGFGEMLTLFDVSDPSDVVVRGQIPTPPATHGAVLDGYAWSFGFDGLDIWDISDLDQPLAAGHADIDLLGAEAVARIGNHPVVLTSTDRIVALDASNPAQPAVAGTAIQPGGAGAKDIAIVGEAAIVLQETYGFSIVDAETLAPIGRFDADLPPQLNLRAFEAMHIDGERIYLAAWGYGLLIVDISDIGNPVEIGRYPYDFASEVVAQGDFVYVAKSTNGGELQVIDVSDPTQPVPRGYFYVNTPRRLQIHGDHVYLADALLGGLRVIDVSDPDAPAQVGVYNQDCEYLGNAAYDVVLDNDGTTAFVACHTGMHIVDVSDPQQPQRIGAYWYEPDVYSSRPRVTVRGDRAWYSDARGVHEIDITDPAQPAGLHVTTLTYFPPFQLHASDDGRVFAFTGQAGMHVFGTLPEEPHPGENMIFSDRFEQGDAPPPPPPEPVTSHYDDVDEGFLGTSWTYQGVHYHDVNNVDGVFPNGDTFTAADVGDQLIIERALLFHNEFPEWGSTPNVLTFGTAYIPGDNLSLGAMVKARMDLEQPASAATFDMAYYENGPWGGIVFHLEAWSGDELVASDALAIAGDDPDGRDNIALSSLSVSAPAFDSLYLYATYGDEFSAPRLIIDNFTLTPVAE